jgi:hypothetical protein
VDAIVCVAPPNLCAEYLPAGWTMQRQEDIGYALRPRH